MSPKTRRVMSLAITSVLVAGLFLAACAPAATEAPAPAEPTQAEQPEQPTQPPEAEAEPLIIGAVFNATGWMADYDQPPRSGATRSPRHRDPRDV